jgi:amidase
MAEYTLDKDQKAFAFDATIPPVLEIDAGDTVTFQTGDAAYFRLANGESVGDIGLENFNAVTGPVYVRGSQPGDALRIEILDIQITRTWSVWLPDFGGLGAKTKEMHVMQTPIENGRARLSPSLTVPVEPMIGCIGVAPAEGKGSTFMPAYPFGGNMDLREMSPGTTLYLPVQVPGALLAMGDLHAAMGTAEPTWVSLEASGQATLRINLEKNMPLNYPRLRIGNKTYCLGMGNSFDESYQVAINEVYSLLTVGHKLDPFVAYAYISARVGMHFGGPSGFVVMASVPDMD